MSSLKSCNSEYDASQNNNYLIRSNILHIIIDALRFDVFKNEEMNFICWPNLARLIEAGTLKCAQSNAGATQFVCPSIFALRYPLDDGGYNHGIRDSKFSVAECLQQVGYYTEMHSLCGQLGVSNGYQRGFSVVCGTIDYRFVLMYFGQNYLLPKLREFESGKLNRGEIYDVIVGPYKELIKAIILDHESRRIQRRTFIQNIINKRIVSKAKIEISLLEQYPEKVTERMLTAWPSYLASRLGKTNISIFDRFLERVSIGAILRAARSFDRLTNLGTIKYGRCSLVSDSFKLLLNAFVSMPRPWYVYSHWMDVHDCRYLNRPFYRLYQLRYWFKWRRFKIKGATNRFFSYDAAIMNIDRYIGLILERLEHTGQYKNTVIVVSSDHGRRTAESAIRPKKKFGLRMYREDLDIPIIFSGGKSIQLTSEGLLDSFSASASILEYAKVNISNKHLKHSMISGGLQAVISENAGRGFCDIENNCLYFSVTTKTHKALFEISENSSIKLIEMFDKILDYNELNDISTINGHEEIVEKLLHVLWRERSHILHRREITSEQALLNAYHTSLRDSLD